MRGLIKRLSILISVCIIALFAICLTNNNGGNNSIDAPVRDVEVKYSNIDAESIFNSYYNAEIKAEDSVVTFSGDKHYDSSNIDLVSLSEEDYSTIHFDYEYDGKENVFVLKVEVSDDNNETESEIIKGIPFYDENNKIDIVFNVEGESLLLSDFTQSGIENCGLFKKVLKKASSACKGVKNAIEDVAEATLEVVKETAPVIVAVGAVAVIYGASVVASGGATLAFAPGVGAAVGAVLEGTLIAGTAIAGTYVAASIAADVLDDLSESELVNVIDSYIDDFNKTLLATQVWTLAELQSALALATKIIKNDSSDTVVYLGRDPEYMSVSLADTKNNVVTFHLDDWMFYENKHGKAGMWLLNYAFLKYVIKNEKNNNWQIRLTTDYTPYLTVRGLSEEGYFYSKEIDFLKNTGHIFDTYRTYDDFGSYYIVR